MEIGLRRPQRDADQFSLRAIDEHVTAFEAGDLFVGRNDDIPKLTDAFVHLLGNTVRRSYSCKHGLLLSGMQAGSIHRERKPSQNYALMF
jgi:hypothetical protein